MDFDVETLDGPVTCVRLLGRLDAAGAARIESGFSAAVGGGDAPAAIDLSGVSYIGSMGLGLLIASARALGERGHALVLFGAEGPVRTVLGHAAIDEIIPVVATRDEALARLAL